jgi:septal ring factor EnvC (AmiA/AmiB activator)
MAALRRVQTLREEDRAEDAANIENLTRLLSDSDKKRHELFEQCTEHVRELETCRRYLVQAADHVKALEAERARLSADNRMLFSLLVSERSHNDRRRSMEASNDVSGLVAAANALRPGNGR